MTRLGLWGRENGTYFEDQNDFMERSGFKHSTGALELIAMGAFWGGVWDRLSDGPSIQSLTLFPPSSHTPPTP